MSRQARVMSETGYYHIIMRGINKSRIFEKKDAKAYFLKTLEKIELEGLLAVAAWCIMDNHVHLVVKAEPEDLAIAFKRINIKYAMYYNKSNERVGHVFQDRFKSETVTSDAHLINVVRYVHNNPVKAKMVDTLNDYEWSSYKLYLFNPHTAGMKLTWELFQQDVARFKSFHLIEDHQEYLEIKEDQQKFRVSQAEADIQEICRANGIEDEKMLPDHPEVMREIVEMLMDGSALSGRQIAGLLGIAESRLRRIRQKK